MREEKKEYKSDNDYKKHEEEMFKTMNNKYSMNNLTARVKEELKKFN